MRRFIMLLAIMSLVLSGCGQKTLPQANNGETAEAGTAPSAAIEQSATPTPTPTPTATATPTPTPTPVKPEYYISSAYFVKPLDKNGNNKVVLLTFDDGPKAEETLGGLLDTLDKHHAKAIFFVNGYRVKQNPDLLKEIYERGQTIGNHSWDHIDLSKENKEKVEQQIGDVQQIVKDTTGYTPVFFRPPYGAGKGFVKEVCAKNNLLYMTWSNGSLDWADNQHKPDGVIQSVLQQLHPGSNILMHELPWTVAALDELLTTLEEKGYSFVDPRTIDLHPPETAN
ncbi:MAG TPA: polysaccharide deacetylase family protein [Bacilli bacterium]